MSKNVLIGIVIVIILLGIGIFVTTKLPEETVTSNDSQNDSPQVGSNTAEEDSQSSVGEGVLAGAEVKIISGTIEKIDGNKLTVKINSTESSTDSNLETRIITVDPNTAITLTVQSDLAEFQKKMQEFRDRMMKLQEETSPSQDPALLVPPTPSLEKKDGSLSDLKENYQVLIIANEDIKNKKEFTATEIEVIPTSSL